MLETSTAQCVHLATEGASLGLSVFATSLGDSYIHQNPSKAYL